MSTFKQFLCGLIGHKGVLIRDDNDNLLEMECSRCDEVLVDYAAKCADCQKPLPPTLVAELQELLHKRGMEYEHAWDVANSIVYVIPEVKEVL